MTRYAKIIGSGAYIPSEEHGNDEFRQRFGAEVINKNEEATGFMTRFRAPADWAASDMAVEACRLALRDAGLQALDIDLIVLGTDTPDYITPATSVVVQHKLGATNAGTFDVGCACASFPTGLAIASGMMANQANIRRVLVVGVYMMHRLADLENDPMSFYYGDGAGAVVLQASEEPGFISSSLFADGSYNQCWGIYSSGTVEPPSEESLKAGRTRVKFVTPFPSSVNREGWPKRVREVAKNGNFGVNDIDHIVFTQVRSKTITQVMEDLGLPENKAIKIMHEYGYMGSACIPVAFDIARKKKLVGPGSLVVFMGRGWIQSMCGCHAPVTFFYNSQGLFLAKELFFILNISSICRQLPILNEENKMEAAPMKSLVSKNSIFLMVMVFLFSFVASMASAVNKQEMFELGERIRVLQNRITDAYEELRKLNEEGGDQAQEQAQIVMAQIKEMKIELQKLQKIWKN